MVTSLPSVSLSPSAPHAQYRKHFRASYNVWWPKTCMRAEHFNTDIYTELPRVERSPGETGKLERCLRWSDLKEFVDHACLILSGRLFQRGVALLVNDHERVISKFIVKLKRACFKGCVERSLPPWAFFLIFTRNRPWKSEDHLCTLFFIEMSKERLEKSERTPPVSWRPWALVYSRDRPYNFSCLSAVSKNRRFSTFFSALGCHLARKSFWWPAMPVSNKKQRVWAAKTNQTVRWLLSVFRFCPQGEHGRSM